MYYILAKYFYYSGTYGAEKDGPLKDERGNMIFATKHEAEQYLLSRSCINFSASKWTWNPHHGMYRCAHGEYSPPVYWIRKVRS